MDKILGICGSLRAQSFNRKLLDVAVSCYGACDFQDANIDLPLYNGDVENNGLPASVQTLADQLRHADGVIICTPEYNKAIPGGLKNAFDWISRIPGGLWARKPVATLSAAAGRSGGEAGLYHMRHCLLPLGADLITQPTICVGQVHDEFDDTGALNNDRYVENISKLMQNLAIQIAKNKV